MSRIEDVLLELDAHKPTHAEYTGGWWELACSGCDFANGRRLSHLDWTPHHAHRAEIFAAALSAAGFGLVADTKAPEVRYSTLTNGEAELDEVVATNATVHLEAMNDNHWWLLVESGGESVHVNFYTKRAKIRGHAETDS